MSSEKWRRRRTPRKHYASVHSQGERLGPARIYWRMSLRGGSIMGSRLFARPHIRLGALHARPMKGKVLGGQSTLF